MKKFDKIEFETLVKETVENIKNVLYDRQAKFLVMGIVRDQEYDVVEFFDYVESLVEKHHPEYKDYYTRRKWATTLKGYVKAATSEYEWDEVKAFETIIKAGEHLKGKRKEAFYKEEFFKLMEMQGHNPRLVEQDMILDLFGWKTILDRICGVEIEDVETTVGIKEFKVVKEVIAEAHKVEKKESERKKSVSESGKKTRRREVWEEIQQLTLDGKFVKSFKTIQEILDELSKDGITVKRTDIAKCVYGHSKQSRGFKWVGIPKKTTGDVMTAA